MTARVRLSTRARVEFFMLHGGKCASCGMRCDRGWQLDHVLPLALGGADEASNWQVLCTACHRAKTATEDVPRIRKAERTHAKHIGARAPSRTPMPHGKNARTKRKLTGEVVPR